MYGKAFRLPQRDMREIGGAGLGAMPGRSRGIGTRGILRQRGIQIDVTDGAERLGACRRVLPNSGTGTYSAPTTTAFTTRPIVNTRSNEALRDLVKRINADPTQVALHLNLLKLLQTKIFQVSSETIYEELKASHVNVAEVPFFLWPLAAFR